MHVQYINTFQHKAHIFEEKFFIAFFFQISQLKLDRTEGQKDINSLNIP